jgi:hypothetical protein
MAVRPKNRLRKSRLQNSLIWTRIVLSWPALATPVKILVWCPEWVEPNEQNGKESATPDIAKKSETAVPCPSPPCPGLAGEDVARVVLAWAKLTESIRAAIMTLVDAAKNS